MVTIKDVAQISGVSKTTVSEVLSGGRRPVHPDTRQRVLEAARHLDYRPNALARGLVGKRMNTIGLVFSQGNSPQGSPFVLGALLGILAQAERRKQTVMLFNIGPWNQANDHLAEMTDGRCDGLIVLIPPEDNPLLEALLRRKVPSVLLSAHEPTGRMPWVGVDDHRAAAQITTALLQMGHRRIGFARPSWLSPAVVTFARERQEGYRQALVDGGAFDPAIADLAGEAAVTLALRSPEPPTAIFAVHDEFALYLLDEFQREGIRVPEDVSLVGFDDIPEASTRWPALSTVRQPLKEYGEHAVEILLGHIDGTIPEGHRELLLTELVLRDSTRPAAQ